MPLILFLKHQNQWSLRLSDRDCWAYGEKDTITSVSLNDSYIIHESCNHPSLSCSVPIWEINNSLQRMGTEKLLKLHPASLSYIQLQTFSINTGKRWSNYFQKKIKESKLKACNNWGISAFRCIWNKVCISSLTTLPLSHRPPKGVRMNFKSPLPWSINEYFLCKFKNVPESLLIP